MAKNKSNTWENVVKPIVVLVVICLITSALLAVTNYFTAPIIKEKEQQAAYAAYFEVLPGADSFTTVEGFATTGVEEAVKADNGTGYAFKAVGKGFGGDVPVIVGMDMNGVITGVAFMQNSETSGFGARLWDGSEDGAAFAEQLTGKSGEVTLGQDGVDGLSGATVTSNAVVGAINSAVNCFNEVALGQAAVVEEEPLSPEEQLEQIREHLDPEVNYTEIAIPEGLTGAWQSGSGNVMLRAEANGYENETKPLDILVEFDPQGVVVQVWVGIEGQTTGIGDQAGGADFLGQFAGIADEAGLDGVDTIAGATQSSSGVIEGVRKCIQAYAAGLAS